MRMRDYGVWLNYSINCWELFVADVIPSSTRVWSLKVPTLSTTFISADQASASHRLGVSSRRASGFRFGVVTQSLKSKDLGVTQAGNLLASPFSHSALRRSLECVSINYKQQKKRLEASSPFPVAILPFPKLIGQLFFCCFVTSFSSLDQDVNSVSLRRDRGTR